LWSEPLNFIFGLDIPLKRFHTFSCSFFSPHTPVPSNFSVYYFCFFVSFCSCSLKYIYVNHVSECNNSIMWLPWLQRQALHPILNLLGLSLFWVFYLLGVPSEGPRLCPQSHLTIYFFWQIYVFGIYFLGIILQNVNCRGTWSLITMHNI